ncbi:2-oxo acid dehydrogenase subunit E2 [Arthrobacter gengyunqii]|uniref:Dihydrolipoamide acetyltransferase component of pyruvate dehydrogenase complex n=1 Tax=Arthrobacter gengyunqii TaxID=2886940 RepID=A0A9X1M2S7_9MICC|nr:dihydrolipoamide acetyltransferase family protein [Arthrobacter gengyunqii]MCC3269775.1 2-oxo acid dehydrogenase subunit E2 [Arthrobacter gengyunqii]UOY97227.1 2-oxo acid dehydrogenase subunit E2 [Arthrobacter gengyunqii]
MIKEFLLPDLGEGLTESEIVTWYVAVGDKVTLNQVIADVETAKAVVELPSPYAGTVAQLHEQAGTVVEVGAPIVSFDVGGGTDPSSGTDSSSKAPAGSATAEGIAPAAFAPAEPQKRTPNLVGYGAVPERTGRPARRRWLTEAPAPAQVASTPIASPPAAPPPAVPAGSAIVADDSSAPAAERPRSTPPVRKLARDLGVDLTDIDGTGPNGLIVRTDVTRAAEQNADVADVLGDVAAPVPDFGADPLPPSSDALPLSVAGTSRAREERIPIAGMRKHTAAAMVASAFTAPHVTVFLTVDVTASMELLARLRGQTAFDGVKLTPLTLAAKAVCLALSRHPSLNSRWDEAAREIVQYRYVNLGIAAATPRGLMVPNVKDAQSLGLRELAAALGTLAQTARAGKTTPADLGGGTFSISNVGVFGIDAGTPILNPGEAGILALGAVREQPWVHEGALAVRQVMTLSLSFDHRLVDGEQGARFLSDVGAVLTEPAMALALM